jgi:aldose 1-epimerase
MPGPHDGKAIDPSTPPLAADPVIQLEDETQHAVVGLLGAGLQRYTIGSRRIIDLPVANASAPSDAAGKPLIPWPNRIQGGEYEFDGSRYTLAISEPDRRTAIHGLTLDRMWAIVEQADASVTLATVVGPTSGYPFDLVASITYRLTSDGLTTSVIARNTGNRALPFGYGHHPYIRPETDLVDDIVLEVPASTMMRAGPVGSPPGPGPVAGSRTDFGAPRRISGAVLDDCFGDLRRDPKGRATLYVDDIVLWLDEAIRWVMVYSSDRQVDLDRRRLLAVEPMTCPPDAFRSGQDLVVLAPGGEFRAGWGLGLQPARGRR